MLEEDERLTHVSLKVWSKQCSPGDSNIAKMTLYSGNNIKKMVKYLQELFDGETLSFNWQYMKTIVITLIWEKK